MCQPISASPSRDSQPCEPAKNNHTNSAMKKQSENEGTSALLQIPGTPTLAIGAPVTLAAATECCDVATVDHRRCGYWALGRGSPYPSSSAAPTLRTTCSSQD